jgi:hypothetical protein
LTAPAIFAGMTTILLAAAGCALAALFALGIYAETHRVPDQP